MALLKRLTEVFSKPAADPAIVALYGACVSQARLPLFYSEWGVPDTLDGRFDLLVLHVFLVMRRMSGADEAKQQLFDLMFADMDQSLREMGVGDMGIGRRIKPMISAFYGRAQAYEKAMAEGDEALRQVLARNIYGRAIAPASGLQALAAYVRRAAAELETQSVKLLLSGQVVFPSLKHQ